MVGWIRVSRWAWNAQSDKLSLSSWDVVMCGMKHFIVMNVHMRIGRVYKQLRSLVAFVVRRKKRNCVGRCAGSIAARLRGLIG